MKQTEILVKCLLQKYSLHNNIINNYNRLVVTPYKNIITTTSNCTIRIIRLTTYTLI